MTSESSRSWIVQRSARTLLTVTLAIGTLGLSFAVIHKVTEVRQPDSPSVLNQATLRLVNVMDDNVGTFATRQLNCTTATCRAPFALASGHALNGSVQQFRSRYLFPSATRSKSLQFASAVSAVARDLHRIAISTSAGDQLQIIHITLIDDLFVALKFDHEILFGRRSSPVRQLVTAMSELVANSSTTLARLHTLQVSCSTIDCRVSAASAAANAINSFATNFDAKNAFPQRDTALETAFALSVHHLANDVVAAFINESTVPLSAQIAKFNSLSRRDLARVGASQIVLANALKTRT
jgi:hypothetical protein